MRFYGIAKAIPDTKQNREAIEMNEEMVQQMMAAAERLAAPRRHLIAYWENWMRSRKC